MIQFVSKDKAAIRTWWDSYSKLQTNTRGGVGSSDHVNTIAKRQIITSNKSHRCEAFTAGIQGKGINMFIGIQGLIH